MSEEKEKTKVTKQAVEKKDKKTDKSIAEKAVAEKKPEAVEKKPVVAEKAPEEKSPERQPAPSQTGTQRKRGIIHIFASHNNTNILLTDMTGAETIANSSGGKVVKSQHKEGSPYAALKIAENIANEAREKGIFEVEVRVRGPGGNKSNSPGQGSEAAIRSLTRNGLRIITIKNVTPMPHDGCRKKKRFRGKRK